jgi:hypothetical protein
MIRYLNKDGEPISRDLWWKLFRNPGYSDITRSRVSDTFVVETSWVGVACDWETPPKIFVTIVRKKDEPDVCYWTPSRRTASAAHNAALYDHQPKKVRKKA